MEISWGKVERCPAAPAFTTHRPRSDIGRRVGRHTHPDRRACLKVHFRSVLRFASGFHPTRPRGEDGHGQTNDRLMQLPSTRGCLRQAPQRTCTSNRSTMPNAPSLGLRPRSAGSEAWFMLLAIGTLLSGTQSTKRVSNETLGRDSLD